MDVLQTVMDPEIPVLSVVELGIIRFVRDGVDETVEVGVSPTYTGCPATEVIRASIARSLQKAGYAKTRVIDVLSPPWSSDWITVAGREKLARYGIAPPTKKQPACPRCASTQTEKISEFGSTPCKAHYRCLSCAEPFDSFKCI